jgi:uncharacterized protein YkwD
MRKDWNFSSGRQGFSYADDVFDTDEPAYATGGWVTGGALRVQLGGVDNADVSRMSGGWTAGFALTETEDVTLTFRVKVSQSGGYERNEYSEVRVAIDGEVRMTGLRISGDGEGGGERTTGWRTVTIDLGELDPGQHELTLGGFNNLKTDRNESTTLLFDDVRLVGTPVEPVDGGDGDGGDGDPDGGDGDNDSGGGIDLEAFEARVFELTNAFRAKNGKDAFQNDTKLNAAAEDWSRSMANGDFFKHSTPAQVEEQGYDWRSWGENIAVGYSTPEAVVDGWINSPGHRANMLSDKFEELGVGYYYLANDSGSVSYRHYWTQVFGTEADSLV